MYAIVGKEKSRNSINWNGNPLCLRRINTTQFATSVYGDYNDILYQIYACGYQQIFYLIYITQWYRIYTDKWIEQGSFILQIQNNTTVNYHKLFQYNATLSITQHNTSTSAPMFNGTYDSYFIIVDVCYGNTSKWCSWVAQGYQPRTQ